MSHKKFFSQGHIPFSWEEEPGVSKFILHQKSSSDMDLRILSEGLIINRNTSGQHTRITPPPPCSAPRKGASRRFQDDPFLAALKACTESVPKRSVSNDQSKGKKMKTSLVRNSSMILSCKRSCDHVETDNFIKFTKLPPLPLPKRGYKANNPFVKK